MNRSNKTWKVIGMSLAITVLTLGLLYTRFGMQIGGQNANLEHTLAIKISAETEDIYNLYIDYLGDETNWIEVDSVNKPPGGLNNEQSVRFALPDVPLGGVRIRLGTHPDTINFRQIALITLAGNTCIWKGSEFSRIFTQTSDDVASITQDGDQVMIVTQGTTPLATADPFTLEAECDQASAMTPLKAGGWLLGGVILFGLLYGLFLRLTDLNASVRDLALSAGFMILLTLPLIGSIFRLNNTVMNPENRALNVAPDFPTSLEALSAYPGAWANYFNDHFGWRSEFLFLVSLFRIQVLNTTPVNGVVLGKDQWLFFSGDDAILDHQGLKPLKNSERTELAHYLSDTQQKLAEKGIRFLVVIAPDKHTIYPEYLPDSIRQVTPNSRLSQLLDSNRVKTEVPFVYLRSTLLDHKDAGVLYFKSDTHWNYLGGFFGYQEIIRQLASDFPVLHPHELTDYTITSRPIPGMDLAKLTGQRWHFMDTQVDLSPNFTPRAYTADLGYRPISRKPAFARQVDDPTLPTAVIFHDSFARYLFPYLAEHFRRSVYIWSYQIDWDVIEREQPDIVILQFVERQIMRVAE